MTFHVSLSIHITTSLIRMEVEPLFLWAMIGVAATAVIVVRKISMLELVLVSIPFMFFPPLGIAFNVSVADFLLPALVVVTWRDWRRMKYSPDSIRLVAAAANSSLAFVVTVASVTLWDAFWNHEASLKLFAIDGFKLAICLTYYICLTICLLATTAERRQRALTLWITVASLLALGSIFDLLPSDGFRSLGYFQDPNLYAAYLLVTITLVMHMATKGQLRWWPGALAVLALGVVTTGSRGAMVAALLLISATIVLIGLTRVGLLTISLAASVTMLWVWQPDLPSRLGLQGLDRLTSATAAAGSDPRLNLWDKAIDLWQESPITGIGLGQYTRFSHGLTPYVGDQIHGQVAHNTFLSFAAETGLLGLISLLTLLLVPTVMILRTRRPTTPSDRALIIGTLVIFAMMLSLNLQNLRYVWAFLAISLAAVDRTGGLRTNTEAASPANHGPLSVLEER